MYSEIIVVCSDIHSQHINAICGHNLACLNTKFKYLNTQNFIKQKLGVI